MKIDLLICQKLKAKDQAGLQLLYNNYLTTLLGIANGVLNNLSHSEDAVQKSILKIWDNIDSYDASKSTLFTWMAQITRNTAIDIRRLKSFEKESKSETYDPHVHNNERVEQNVNALDAKKVLNLLDDKYSIVLDHLYLKGYTQKEVSDKLNIPLGTIKTRVKKGIDILRSKLTDEQKLFIGFLSLILLIFII